MAATTSSQSSPLSSATRDASVAVGIYARITASVDNWKRKLLDLTMRNRALNFRPTKVSTITIVDEHPAEVFRQLYLREQGMKFKAAPEGAEERPREGDATARARSTTDDGAASSGGSSTVGGTNGSGAAHADAEATAAAAPIDAHVEGIAPATPLEEDEDGALELDFAPYDPVELDDRHTDEWLQTTATPEALDRSLRRLDEQARLAIEEQGVNTLFVALGMLHYVESEESPRALRAPLVLLPVELTRKSARSGYIVRATDDDPLVNPTLVEYLRANFGITLPELPDSNAIPDDYDLQTFLKAASDAVAGRPGWGVKTDVSMALFSFQKFAMYKDLEANGAALAKHRLIRQLITRSGEHIVGLPAEIRSLDLDKDFPPEGAPQVVDADATQLRAILAASRGHDLVVEGPPGTGKSQTITNLIAQSLAAGKSVLFVAEKMAALQVVHGRLVAAGLGEFCLELHSTKANKRAVMKELATALDASLQPIATPTASTQRLPQVRAMLSDYVRAVHTPNGALGISPYRAYGELGRVLGAPRVKYTGAIDAVTQDQLEQTVRDLGDLAAAARDIGVPSSHPWRDGRKTFYAADDLEAVRELAEALDAKLADVMRRAEGVETAFSLPSVSTFADVETATSVAAVLARSPGAPLDVLSSPAWNAPPAEATALVERGRALSQLAERVAKQFVPEVIDQDHSEDIEYVERKSQGFFAFLAFLDERYRTIKRRWLAYRLPSYRGTLSDQANEMKQVDRVRAERRALTMLDSKGRSFFGALWRGERTPWDALDQYINWVVEFRAVCVKHGMGAHAFEVAAKPAPDVSDVHAMRDAAVGAAQLLAELRAAVGWPDSYLATETLGEIRERVSTLAASVALGPRWASFEAARQTVEAGIARELLAPAMNGEVAFDDLGSAFLRAFYLRWLSDTVRSNPTLERFHTRTHEERVAEFRKLDEMVLKENRAALVSQLRDRAQHALQKPEAAAAMPFLRREMARQRGLSPLRKTLRNAETAIRAIKPCLMMSPLSVAQYLDGAAPTFDLVIFDEASQLPSEDAVGAVIRGRQLVVVGDPKQLPPTNFFAAQAGEVNVPLADDGTPLYEDSESILEEFMGAGVPMSRLKWHYRSAHESLITFSNVSFYDADLHTFPSVETGTGNEAAGLQFELVDGGVYEGKGLNSVEAKRVADEVVRFAREQLDRRARGETPRSLGVGTFNLRQQLAIQDELEQRRRDDPSIDPFFDRGAAEPFFVKNLENIQGDERDVIFLSVTYAKSPDGRLRYNFGPLNGENGWRRLNVLTTRARQRMNVFSSMRGEEINPAIVTSRGALLLRQFLLYAEHGRLDGVAASAAADEESPLERDVMMELAKRGVNVVPQVGVAGYRIDLGVLDDAAPGRFLCGIECDGEAYHASESARDRDRLRQQLLEARGWTIHRLWSTDWFKDRQGQIDRLMRLIEETRARERRQAEATRELRERALREWAARDAVARVSGQRDDMSFDGPGLAAPPSLPPYERPKAAPYTMTPGEGQYDGSEILEAPMQQLVRAVASVVATESPIHVTDLVARVAGMWGTRPGSRIHSRITEACSAAERERQLRRRGQFFWSMAGTCVLRSRAGTKIPPDRIAPEEYADAIRAVLAHGHGFTRTQLTNEVRAVLGYPRAGATLDEAVSTAITDLLAAGHLGEGSTGIRLRRG